MPSSSAVQATHIDLGENDKQMIVINIANPAQLNIDMSLEGERLESLRQQTDRLKASLSSLESNRQALNKLSAVR